MNIEKIADLKYIIRLKNETELRAIRMWLYDKDRFLKYHTVKVEHVLIIDDSPDICYDPLIMTLQFSDTIFDDMFEKEWINANNTIFSFREAGISGYNKTIRWWVQSNLRKTAGKLKRYSYITDGRPRGKWKTEGKLGIIIYNLEDAMAFKVMFSEEER